jgi:hypothetical protein
MLSALFLASSIVAGSSAARAVLSPSPPLAPSGWSYSAGHCLFQCDWSCIPTVAVAPALSAVEQHEQLKLKTEDETAAALQLWGCDNITNRVARVRRAPNHHQSFKFNVSEQTLKLVSNSAPSGLCVDRSGNHQFAALLLSPCDQSEGQLWNVSTSTSTSSDTSNSSSSRSADLVTIQSQMLGSDFGCIGASAPVSAGTPLQLAPDCGSLLTEWQQLPTLLPQSSGVVHYRLKYSK